MQRITNSKLSKLFTDWLRYGGHINAVELLLENGASPFVKNKHDKTPLMDVNEVLPTILDERIYHFDLKDLSFDLWSRFAEECHCLSGNINSQMQTT